MNNIRNINTRAITRTIIIGLYLLMVINIASCTVTQQQSLSEDRHEPVKLDDSNPQKLHFVFPDIVVGQKVSHKFILINNTDRTLQLQAHVSCGCTNVEFNRPTLKKDETTVMDVSYNSAIEPIKGTISRQFMIADVSNNKAKVLISGSFKIIVNPGLALDPDQISAQFNLDGENNGIRSIDLTNHTSHSLSIQLTKSENTEEILIKPNKIKLSAFSRHHVKLDLSNQLPDVPISTVINIKAIDPKNDKFILHRHILIKLTPKRLLQSMPGSLVFGPDDAKGRKLTKKFHFVTDSKVPVNVDSVKSKSPMVHVTKWSQEGFTITVTEDKNNNIVNTNITIIYGKHRKHTLKVPVIGIFK